MKVCCVRWEKKPLPCLTAGTVKWLLVKLVDLCVCTGLLCKLMYSDEGIDDTQLGNATS